MKSGFSDPIEVKKEQPSYKPVDGKNTPWEHQQPQYDERSSCFVNTGTHFGIGHRQPVGHADGVKSRVSTMPFGRVNTQRVDEAG